MIARRIAVGATAALALTTITGVAASSASAAQPAKKYTAAQVAKHSTAKSCWTSINGKVYDLTSWIARHPGGSGPIMSVCGRDGSAAFNGQHQGQGRPEAMLKAFRIGTLG